MIKKFLIFILAFTANLFLINTVSAVCPVCTIAVGAGVGFSRWLGIDDMISGLWIGGLTVSLIMWTIEWLNKKNIKFKGKNLLTFILYYLLIVMPLFYFDIMGHPLNKVWGVDKLLLGIIFGSVFFYLGSFYYEYLKKKNNDKAYFPYQKVVMPVSSILILSIIFYFITK